MSSSELEKFWKGYPSDKRAKAEADAVYQAAVKAGEYTKAQERACEVVEGNAITKKQMKNHKILSKARQDLNEILR